MDAPSQAPAPLTIAEQIGRINELLHAIYRRPMRLSDLLQRHELDAEALAEVRRQIHALLPLLAARWAAWLQGALPARHAALVVRRFSLDGRQRPAEHDLAADYGLPAERLRHIERRALRLLKVKKRRRTLERLLVQVAGELLADAAPQQGAARSERPSVEQLSATLRQVFSIDAFRPGQLEAIMSLLAGKNMLVVMPTGAGKSLIYQLAALHRPGVTIVISPLIALMKDQVDGLLRQGVRATVINSTLSAAEQSQRLREMVAGRHQLVYVAPERLRSSGFLSALQRTQVGLLVVDEAHCVSEWGHDFRPDYRAIARARELMGGPTTVALTATATDDVREDIVRHVGLDDAHRIVTGFNRPNIAFEVRITPSELSRTRMLRTLLGDHREGAAIIYGGTRKKCEELAEELEELMPGQVAFYHAGLESAKRAEIQERFLSGALPVIVATNAFGMGIDRADVRLVVHATLPGTLEAYYQEAGRAGRDGKAARAVLLYSPADCDLQEWFIDQSAPTPEEERTIYRALHPLEPESPTLIQQLVRATGLGETKVRLALAHFEAAGMLGRAQDGTTQVAQWNDAALRAEQKRLEAHLRARRSKLNEMVRYAETVSCRRRFLLKYFGDTGPAEAPICCDNCRAQRPRLQSRATVGGSGGAADQRLQVLGAVDALPWNIGQQKLIQILQGSGAQGVAQSEYQLLPQYGSMARKTQRAIGRLIEQLIDDGYLQATEGARPVLKLTRRGRELLPQPERPEEPVRPKDERPRAATSAAATAELLRQGYTPAEIAKQRSLKEETVYQHLAEQIEEGALELSVAVSEDHIRQIRAGIARIGSLASLPAIKAVLPQEISHGELRCVATALRSTAQQLSSDGSLPIRQTILDCVASFPGQLRRSWIAKLLAGSASSRLDAFKSSAFYGALSDWQAIELLLVVDELINEGALEVNAERMVVPGQAELPGSLELPGSSAQRLR